jgi:16S rRNA (uracil1498-N3)-methyltransferase
MHLFYTPDIATSRELPEEEAAHALRVLRLGMGDEVMLTDGRGHFFPAEVAECTSKRCFVHVRETITPAPLWKGHLHLAMAPTKNMDRMEWLAEKATEIGFDELSLLDCRYSERRVVKTERLDKILVSAMKQSLKATKPVLNALMPFERFVRQPFAGQRFIAHCHSEEEVVTESENEQDRSSSYCVTSFRLSLREALSPDKDALVLIGPEGDFSVEEVRLALSLGFRSVSLGNSRLRTETAALVAVHLMHLTHS